MHTSPLSLHSQAGDTGCPSRGGHGLAGDATEVLTDPSANIFGVGQEEVPHQCIESNPGDAVFFSHQLFHASFGGGVRHMFTLNFRAALPSDQEEQLRMDWDDVMRRAEQAARL